MEIVLAAVENLKVAFGFCLFALLAYVITNLVIAGHNAMEVDLYSKDSDRQRRDGALRRAWKTWPVFVFIMLVLSVPSIDNLWKVRIALIKYHLADRENLEKSADTIERIGKKLECKYLGCNEEHK